MKRDERGLLVLGSLVVLALVVGLLVGAKWFATNNLSNGSSNLLGILAGPSLLVAVTMGAWIRWHRTCKVPWCLRLGEHPVKGTTAKVCTHHHTLEHHRIVFDLHQVEGRLGWGESHDK